MVCPDQSVNSLVYMFADNAKCFRQISDPPDSVYLQGDLHQLESWKDTWNLKVNVTEEISSYAIFCKASYLPVKLHSRWSVSETLSTSLVHKDLGVLISPGMIIITISVTSRAYKELSILCRCFNSLNSSLPKRTLW